MIKYVIKITYNDELKKKPCKVIHKYDEMYGDLGQHWRKIFLMTRSCRMDNYNKGIQYKRGFLRFVPRNKLLCQINKIDSPKCNYVTCMYKI